jgi:hypothetical protein
MKNSRIGRSVAVLAVAALAVAVVSPAFSAAPLTKGKVKKIAKQQIKKLVPGMIEDADNVVETAHFLLSDGESRVIISHGPFTVTANCDLDAAGQDTANMLIATSQDNSSFDASDENDDFDVADLPADRDWGSAISVAANTTEVEGNIGDGAAISPTGTTLILLNTWTSVNPPFALDRCGFAAAHLLA